MICRFLLLLLVASLICHGGPAAADIVVDGVVDADYGPALAVQTTQSDFWHDPDLGLLGPANGSELDGAYGVVSGDVLYVIVTGNLLCEGNPVDYGLLRSNLELFVDCLPGGQNAFRGDNWNPLSWGTTPLAGLTFDAGFEPDYWLSCVGLLADYYDPNSAYTLNATYATLPTGAGGTGWWLGGAAAGGPGTLVGGTNPDGIRATIDNRNVAGVTVGCAGASGAGVTQGIEWAIPLAAIGNPTGPIRISAFLTSSSHGSIGNQVLAPVPPGTCSLGAAASVSFANHPGDQFFTVPGATPAHRTSWGALKSIYR